MTGGTDRMIRRWDASSGEPIGAVAVGTPEDPLAAYAGDHGAEIFRACVACHTLTPDEGNKAGPTLYGIFGRTHCDAVRLQFFARTEKTRHRVDARDGVKIVRGRARALYAWHQDAGANDRVGGRSQGAGGVSRQGDDEQQKVTNFRPSVPVRGGSLPSYGRAGVLARQTDQTVLPPSQRHGNPRTCG